MSGPGTPRMGTTYSDDSGRDDINVVHGSELGAAGALSADRTYRWVTAFWLAVMAVSGLALWLALFGVSGPSEPMGSDSWLERDDADALVVAFGQADDDRVTGIDAADPLIGRRVMTYARRRLRVTFVRRLRGTPPRGVWKLEGFAEANGAVALSGEEALRRLKSPR